MKELNALENHAERQPLATTAIHQAAHYNLPDARGHFGPYGGTFVSETLTHALTELKEGYA
ncbi:MAG: tryptophan synthase subunit beta, partial [Noviherbaspirillum sp.]